jgi:hypothetical protein
MTRAITVIGAIQIADGLYLHRHATVFLRILRVRSGNSVSVGLSVNPYKGGFVADD